MTVRPTECESWGNVGREGEGEFADRVPLAACQRRRNDGNSGSAAAAATAEDYDEEKTG